MAGLYLLVALLVTVSVSTGETVAEKEHKHKVITCALIASEAVEKDPAVMETVTASVHSSETTLEKLYAEIAHNCFRAVTSDYAAHINDSASTEDFSIAQTEAQALILYQKHRYLDTESDMLLTKEERELMNEILRVMQSEGKLENPESLHREEL